MAPERTGGRGWPGDRLGMLIAVALTAIVTGLYTGLLIAESVEREPRTLFVLSALLAAVLAMAGALALGPGQARAALAGWALGSLLAWGVLGIFSIGLGLLLAAIPATWSVTAWSRGPQRGTALVGGLAAVAVAFWGVALT